MSESHDYTRSDAPELVALVYDQLHRIAAGYLRQERADHTLQPTALVHEAYMKVADGPGWKDEAHFRASASRAMRQVLVDHARARGRHKRGGDRDRILLTTGVAFETERDLDVLALDEALDALAALDGRKARVVELRFFGGLSARESSEILGIARKTVEADWYFARAWLHARLDGD
jgi:RNA polymerase sigma factor (TIGR02999 family)